MKPELMLRQLDAPVTIKNFVRNDPKCNYEFYMVELLNNSRLMRERHPQRFFWHESQAHAECDAYSGSYGIDFKLIASQSSLKASSVLTPHYMIDERGFIIGYESKSDKLKNESEITVTRMHAALRQSSVGDLERIRSGEILHSYEKDVRVFLEKLETRKNLLLFYPYEYRFSDGARPDDGVERLTQALQRSFVSALGYRKKHMPQFETYLTTVYYDDFVLYEVVGERLCLMDVVSGSSCPTFGHLRKYDWIGRQR